MKSIIGIKKFVSLIFALAFFTAVVSAQNQHRQTRYPNRTSPKITVGNHSHAGPSSTPETVALSHDSLARLKAVLVVGPVEELTKDLIVNMKEVADYLRRLGIHVTTFYDPDAIWTDIARAAEGAHIFVYSGHGTNAGEHGSSGGFCLSRDVIISSASIVKDLKLHKNALIIFPSVCLAAGSSAADSHDIGSEIAVQRVSDYALPFVKSGAAGYYANNYSGEVVSFLREFFNRKNIKQIYIEAVPSFCHIEKTQKYTFNQKYEVSVTSTTNPGTFSKTTYTNGVKKVERVKAFKAYDMAFVGIPGFTVTDFFE